MPAALLPPNNISLIHNDNPINLCLIPQAEILLISPQGIIKIITATIYHILSHTAVALGTLTGLFYKYILTMYVPGTALLGKHIAVNKIKCLSSWILHFSINTYVIRKVCVREAIYPMSYH